MGDAELQPSSRRQALHVRRWIAAAVALVLVGAGAFAILAPGDDTDGPTQVAAPGVTAGSADLVVLSDAFDEEGARQVVAPDLVDRVRQVAGVNAASGVARRFLSIGGPEAPGIVSERSAIALSWDPGTDLELQQGRAPETAGDVVVNTVAAQRFGLGLGSQLPLADNDAPYVCDPGGACRPEGPTHEIVGVFSLPGGDVTDVPLVAFTVDELLSVTRVVTGYEVPEGVPRVDPGDPGEPYGVPEPIFAPVGFDRIDIDVADDADAQAVRASVAALLSPPLTVVSATALGSREQLRAELEIQRAYWYLLSTDPAKRVLSTQSDGLPPPPENDERYEANAEAASQAELRVQRVSFLDASTASLTYVIYYGGSRSPVVPDPQGAIAVIDTDGTWRISRESQCRLANLGGFPCDAQPGEDATALSAPPEGWDRVDAVPGLAEAFSVIADPSATVEARLAVVDNGEAARAVIERGVADDRASGVNVTFHIAAARLIDATHAEILYSLVTSGGTRQNETPYPINAPAVLVDGQWNVDQRYACGIVCLASGGATTAPPGPATTIDTPVTNG